MKWLLIVYRTRWLKRQKVHRIDDATPESVASFLRKKRLTLERIDYILIGEGDVLDREYQVCEHIWQIHDALEQNWGLDIQ